MPIINAVLGELDHEAKTTLRVLERVPGERLSWAPHPKSSSLGRLAWHIATIPATVQALLRAGSFDVAQARPSAVPEDAGAIVAGFRRNVGEARAFLAGLDDDVLREPFTLRRGEQTVMTIPKIAVIRSILMNHTYHHRGQLTVYLRLLDVPVPVVYGTTADEQM